MKRVLISGGQGDIACAIMACLKETGEYDVLAPSKKEMDVTNWSSIESIVCSYVPDILINNAGYIVSQPIKKANLTVTKSHIDINLCGTFYCTEICLKYNPALQVINIGSASATKANGLWSEYCAAKAAVVMATECWAKEGIYSICISPGRVKTKMRKRLFPNEDQNRLLLPENIAEIVLKAIKKEYPSGSNINVNKENFEMLKVDNFTN